MRISVYGSSRPKPGEPAYEEAMQLGMLLAQARHTVLTGGNTGTMEAVSRGAAEYGGHVIGVTCEEIESWRPTGANRWVKEEWRTPSVFTRIESMLQNSDAAIALPGGVGTLTEIMITWNQMSIDAWYGALVLVGSGWKDVFTTLFKSTDGISDIDSQRLEFVQNGVEAARRFQMGNGK